MSARNRYRPWYREGLDRLRHALEAQPPIVPSTYAVSWARSGVGVEPITETSERLLLLEKAGRR